MSSQFAFGLFVGLSAGTGLLMGLLLRWRGNPIWKSVKFAAYMAFAPSGIFFATFAGVYVLGRAISSVISTREDAVEFAFFFGFGPLACVFLTWLWIWSEYRQRA